ncbi:MAG TPA: leucyl/phenylalanyl-tRNA--protein transferase [Fimbriimonadaceae bacterium]|mgnify:CR=1 FL=1|nr:leucyl/phenylalanyl-tRNA--protein transferase [Fimbriimonadaceae bacterium]
MAKPILESGVIQYAYANGWFPMADDDGSMSWYQPQRRALFPISGIRVSRSLRRRIGRSEFEIRFDSSFRQVVESCRRPEGNWINGQIIEAYSKAHEEGWAHCAECWKDGALVGGIYGLALGGCFSAESMFHRQTDASKVALWAMVERCRELGFRIFDAQVMNPHLASLGAYEVSVRRYLEMLHDVLPIATEWGPGLNVHSSPSPSAR